MRRQCRVRRPKAQGVRSQQSSDRVGRIVRIERFERCGLRALTIQASRTSLEEGGAVS